MRVLRRGAAQWPLLLAVLAVLVAGGTLAGTCALLLTAGDVRAVEAAAERADGTEGSGSADLARLTISFKDDDSAAPPRGVEVARLLAGIEERAAQALAPFPVTTSTWATSSSLYLPGTDVRQAYLLDADTAERSSTLVTGRWPDVDRPGSGTAADPLEVAVPRAVATALDLTVGSRVWLGASPEHHGAPSAEGVQLEVVGVVDLAGSRWQRDQLRGAGSSVGGWVPLWGPMLVAPGALVGGGVADAPVALLNLEVDPDLTGHPDALAPTAQALGGLERTLTENLAERASFVIVRTGLPAFVADMAATQRLTATSVLTVALLAALLAATATGLVARLVTGRRSEEAALLRSRGAGRWQLARADAAEGLVLGVVAVGLAVPAAIGAYAALVASPLLADAWALRAGSGGGGLGGRLDARALTTVVLAVAAAVLLQVAVAVVTAARSATLSGGPARRRTVARGAARSGADVLLVALAGLGVAQLATHHPGRDRVDPVLVVAPVLCVAAVAVLALRLLPLVALVLERRARRSTGLTGPVAAWRVARGRASAGVLLVVLAAVVSTLGVSWGATWWTSQQDQADAAVGPDVVVPADGRIGEGARLAADVPVVRLAVPATHRTVALGSRPGGVPLVALDTTRAAEVVRGRLPGAGTWSAALAPLAPSTARDGLTVTGTGVPVEVSGTYEPPSVVSASTFEVTADLSAVLEDQAGARTLVPVGHLPLDGTTLRTRLVAPDGADLPEGRWSVVALDAVLHTVTTAPLGAEDGVSVSISLRVPGAAPAVAGATWTGRGTDDQTTRGDPVVTRTGDVVDVDMRLSLFAMSYTDVGVVAMGFAPAETLPIALPADLAREAGLHVGDAATVATGTTTLPARVAAVVPYVPSESHGPALLADSDALSRALVALGDLESVVDEWWLATDGPWPAGLPGTVRADVAEDLRSGPLRAALPASLVLLVLAAVLLATAGSAAHASAGAREHDRQTVRLRVLGAPRRVLGAGAVAQHALLVAVAAALGVGLGAALAWLVLPLVVTGSDGGAAQPPPLPLWPWALEGATVAALLVGTVAAGLPAARSVVRRTAALGPSLREES